MTQQASGEQVSADLVRLFDRVASSPLAKDCATYFFVKRILDLTLSLIALLVLSPLLVSIVLLILVETGWPAIFSQKRVGARRYNCGGHSYWQPSMFTCYKFRSMVRDADPSVHKDFIRSFVEGHIEVSGNCGAQFKLNNDVRVTRVGRIPRPDVLYSVELYEPWQYGRLAATPGITGLWQIKGRSNVTFDHMVRMDIEYINNQSISLDLKILLLTIPAVLSCRGAE
jgi:lipopolysaccharide/colanic/teichoic acid biosynthesis glycosyltransferase